MAPGAADPLSWLFGLERFGVKLGLQQISALLEAAQHPECAYPVIHVGGTNGKGSVTAIIDGALRAAGIRTGRYTSPHLVDLTERFVVNGRPVTTDVLIDVVDRWRHVVLGLQDSGVLQHPPTFFEVTTAAAFEIFRREAVEFAVCEVGLGGRLDATNVVSPIATAITSIGFDHQQHLGATLAEIAREKAGILKPGVPVVVGRMPEDAGGVIRARAREVGAPVVDAWHGVTVERREAVSRVGRPTPLRIRTPSCDYGDVRLGLSGPHQIDNAVVAVRTLEAVSSRLDRLTPSAIRAGLADVVWPGRLDLRTFEDGREVLLDAAHNVDGATALARAIADDAEWRHQPLVCGVSQDKDATGLLAALVPHVGLVVCTRAASARAANPAALADLIRALAPDREVAVEPDPPAALRCAWQRARRIVVAGSIFLVGDVLKALGARDTL